MLQVGCGSVGLILACARRDTAAIAAPAIPSASLVIYASAKCRMEKSACRSRNVSAFCILNSDYGFLGQGTGLRVFEVALDALGPMDDPHLVVGVDRQTDRRAHHPQEADSNTIA